MTVTRRSVTVAKPVGVVAEYLSEFANTAEWDPHTASCERLDAGPVAVGARYRNVQRIAGRDSTLNYRVTEFAPGRRIVLDGDNGGSVRSRDEIDFTDEGDGRTTVTYTADLRFTGLAKLAEPLAALMMKKIGDDAATSLREHLQCL